jgi:deoxyribodipyrimidine photo-lyase
MDGISIFWFRRDLRMDDNAGLYHALRGANPVLGLFIFDTHILDKLEDRDDARVTFLHREVTRLQKDFRERGGDLLVRYGSPQKVWESLLEEFPVRAVYTNRDYETYAKVRDRSIAELCKDRQIPFLDFKDHVIFDRSEVVKDNGDPYVVFTPYSRTWRKKLEEKTVEHPEEGTISYYFQPFPTEAYFDNLFSGPQEAIPSLEAMGFRESSIPIPDRTVSRGLIRKYDSTRNFPAVEGTSRLGIHFRFGTISIRKKALRAQKLNATFLNELIWRDFYAQILDHFPKVEEGPFRAKYSFIEWRNNEQEFEKWCAGQTGYPIVDAGMRQLNTTGYMHNRVRMIVASFLTKHLLINWQWGEAYFARKLLDFDLASNNGGWQWAAGTGTDAAPYFRIFNPTSQQEKFDKQKQYIKQWVEEYGTDKYPDPIVDHKMARQRCLDTYKAALEEADSQGVN